MYCLYQNGIKIMQFEVMPFEMLIDVQLLLPDGTVEYKAFLTTKQFSNLLVECLDE